MGTLINLIHQVSRHAWPPPPLPSLTPHQVLVMEQGHGPMMTNEQTGFGFECLESLWDPDLHRAARGFNGQIRVPATHAPTPLPRATYEEDCEDWIRAPLQSDGQHRGIIQLACLVSDCSLHVYCDFDKMLHTNLFASRANQSLVERRCRLTKSQMKSLSLSPSNPKSTILTMDDQALLQDPLAASAIAWASSSDLLIDASDGKAAQLVRCQESCTHPARCAWLLCDANTSTWSARVFHKHSLTDTLSAVQHAAFIHAVGYSDWQNGTSLQTLTKACLCAAIHVPVHCRGAHESLVTHLRAVLDQGENTR